jgi:hypothetical protein
MGLKKKKWFQTLMTLAPKVGAALGGPVAGLALAAVKSALGMPDASESEIEAKIAEGSPETLLALRKAEHDFDAKMKELEIREDELVYQDIQSAREMHVKTMDATPAVLTYLAIIVFFGVVALTITQKAWFADDTFAQNAAFMVIGASIAWVNTAFAYWLGSSRGSKAKTDSINQYLQDTPRK